MAELTRQENRTRIIEKITASKKYRGLYYKTVQRIVSDCLKKYPPKSAEKQAKNLLHQIWGAYLSTIPDFKKLEQSFEHDFKNGKDIKQIVLPFLKLQSSLRERVPILNDFYQKIFSATGKPSTIVDWACGLNPLSWPWMPRMNPLGNFQYLGLDIDKQEIDFLNNIFRIADLNNFKVRLGDILTDASPQADVVFLLKTLPLLEHQKKGVSLEILKKMPAKFLVVSFPTRTIRGKNKNMIDFYQKWFHDLIGDQQWKTIKILFPTELVFIINKTGGDRVSAEN